MVLGIVLVLLGILMSGPGIPGPGIVVILLGLSFLALEFDWAERLLAKAIVWADNAKERAEAASPRQKAVTAGLAVLAQDAPARLQQEWQLFWEEVELEAERLERGEAAQATSSSSVAGPPSSWAASPGASSAGPSSWRPTSTDPQEQIDALRAQVAELARRLERPAS